MQSIYQQRVGRLIEIFMSAILLFLYCKERRKLQDLGESIPGQPRTARQAGKSFPGPWKQRVLNGRIRRNGL